MTRDDIFQALEPLAHRARLAFAAECTRRVLDIYEVTWEDERVPVGPQLAVEATHRVAISADPIDRPAIEAARVAVDDAIPPEEDAGSAAYRVYSAAAYALDAVDDPTPEAAWIASAYALDAIDQVDDEAGTAEERRWQLALLQRLAAMPDPVPAAALAAATGAAPAWHTRFMN